MAFQLYTLPEVIARSSEPPKWVIEGLLLDKSGTMCSGQPHSGKSLNWLCAAIESVTTGRVWNRFPSHCQRVLYVETEDPQAVVENRIRGFAKGLQLGELEECGFRLSVPGPFDIVQDGHVLEKAIEEARANYCVLSTLQGLLGARDWKEQKDMAPVNAQFVRMAQTCPIVVITHSTWNKDVRRPAGTITQAANFLTLVHFEKKDDGITQVHVDSKLGDIQKPFKLKLELDEGEVRAVHYKWNNAKEHVDWLMQNYPDMTNRDASRIAGCDIRTAQRVR